MVVFNGVQVQLVYTILLPTSLIRRRTV